MIGSLYWSVAHALLSIGDALALLLDAKEYAPEQVRYHRLSRILVREMIRLPRPSDRAIELAYRMGVHGTDPRRP